MCCSALSCWVFLRRRRVPPVSREDLPTGSAGPRVPTLCYSDRKGHEQLPSEEEPVWYHHRGSNRCCQRGGRSYGGIQLKWYVTPFTETEMSSSWRKFITRRTGSCHWQPLTTYGVASDENIVKRQTFHLRITCSTWHIGVWTNWPLFRRRHFQMYSFF